jgi:hypothetical protein
LDFLPGLPGFFRGEGLRQYSSSTSGRLDRVDDSPIVFSAK